MHVAIFENLKLLTHSPLGSWGLITNVIKCPLTTQVSHKLPEKINMFCIIEMPSFSNAAWRACAYMCMRGKAVSLKL